MKKYKRIRFNKLYETVFRKHDLIYFMNPTLTRLWL